MSQASGGGRNGEATAVAITADSQVIGTEATASWPDETGGTPVQSLWVVTH